MDSSPRLKRPRLIALLANLTRHRVAVLSAPGGYGKTTLIRQAAEQMPGVAFCWLPLDPADASLHIFLPQFIRALSRHMPPDGLIAHAPERNASTPEAVRQIARVVAADLSQHAEEQLVIVLDDLHHIGKSELVPQFLDALIHHLPDSVHLLLACRGRPPVSLSRLQMRYEALVLTADDLAFSEEEADQLLRSCLGVELPPPVLRMAHHLTEGWVAALLLLGNLLRTRETDEWVGILGRFEAGGALFGFLAEEVFEQQPTPVQDFLLNTSVLQILHPHIIERMLGVSGVGATLHELEEHSLFLFRSPGRDGAVAYRYHPLFQSFLRSRLTAWRGESEQARLHSVAARAYESTGDLARAVEHYLSAGENERATALMAEQVDSLIKSLRHDVVVDWLQRIPRERQEQDPNLFYIRAQVAGWLAQYEILPVLYQRALELYEERQDYEGLARCLSWVSNRFAKLRHPYFAVSPARWAESPDLRVRTYGRTLVALQRTACGEWSEAFADIEALLPHIPPATRAYFDTLETLALLAFWHGDSQNAVKYGLIQAAGRTAMGDFGWGIFIWVAYAMMGDRAGMEAYQRQYLSMKAAPSFAMLYELIGVLGQALIHLVHARIEDGLVALESLRPYFNDRRSLFQTLGSEMTFIAQGELARVYARVGRLEEARTCLQRNLELTQGYPEVTAMAQAQMAEFAATTGEMATALACLERADRALPPGLLGPSYVWVRVAALKVALAAGNRASAKRELAALLRLTERQGSFWLSLHVGLPEILPMLAESLTDPGLQVDAQLKALGATAAELIQPWLGSPSEPVRQAAGMLLERLGHRKASLAPIPLRVQAFGPIRLTRYEQTVEVPDWKRTKVRLLLILLLMRRGKPLGKENLMELLWPEAPAATARSNLRVTIHGVKRALEPDLAAGSVSSFVQTDRETVWLTNLDKVMFDLWEFEYQIARARALQREGRQADALAAWQAACDLYRGPFLTEVAYADHFREVRTSTERSYMRASIEVARGLLAAHEYRSAAEYARRALTVDATLEEGYQILIRAYQGLGERERAQQTFKLCRKYLRRLLDVEPSVETRSLLEA